MACDDSKEKANENHGKEITGTEGGVYAMNQLRSH